MADSEFDGNVDEMLQHYAMDSVSKGICSTCEVIVDELEGDAEGDTCEECETPTVNSVLILAGVI